MGRASRRFRGKLLPREGCRGERFAMSAGRQVLVVFSEIFWRSWCQGGDPRAHYNLGCAKLQGADGFKQELQKAGTAEEFFIRVSRVFPQELEKALGFANKTSGWLGAAGFQVPQRLHIKVKVPYSKVPPQGFQIKVGKKGMKIQSL